MSTTLQAAIWMIGSILSFSAMAVAGRELSGSLDTFEIMFYRSLVGVVIVSAVLGVTGRWRQVSTARMGMHLFRNAAHFTGQNLWFFALTVLPLAQVFALEFTTPLWVIVLAPLVLGERLTRWRAFAAALGFVGILIVARPGATPIGAGVLAAAGSAIFFAITLMMTKRLTREESIASILLWLTVMQTVIGLAAVAWDGDIAVPGATSAPWVIVVALCGLLAHFCITNALAIAPATVVVPFDFVRLPAIAVVGMMMYGESLDLWVVIGALVIFTANYLNILAETRKNRVA